MTAPAPARSRLRRDLGTLQAYAAMIGMLVGAGIFRVTGDAWQATGPSVVLGYVLLCPAVMATAWAYAVFASTPLGRRAGGEYENLTAVFGPGVVPFIGAWLKIISYVGALAFLSQAAAEHALHLLGRSQGTLALALGTLLFFLAVHLFGVRWFGRIQVAMAAGLGVSIVVLVGPGLFAIRGENLQPFFTEGTPGLLRSLPLLFFAFAGFESLVHAGAEVRGEGNVIPRVLVRGVLITTAIFALMSLVAFGSLDGSRLAGSPTPMADAAASYLPRGASAVVTLGALLALATSINATFMAPSRLLLTLARDGLAPARLGQVWARTGTPALGLLTTGALAAALLISGQISLALGIAVFALVLLYLVHAVTALVLPWKAQEIWHAAGVSRSRGRHVMILSVAVLSMGLILGVVVAGDLDTLRTTSLSGRIADRSLTALELLALWSALGGLIHVLRPRASRPRETD